jgi:hypothetical protein
MSDMINSVQDSHDDIDLIVVLERISRFLSGNIKTLIITSIVGVICGLAFYYTLPKTYSSTMILRTQVLTNSEEIEIVNGWNSLHSNGENGVLARTLHCTPELISKIKSIKAENIPNLPQPASAFSVTVLVSDTSMLEDLQNAIVYGLENNEFVQAKENFKRDNTIQMIDNINQEIAKLDSTEKKIESNYIGKPSASPLIMVDISNLHVQMITLREKLYQNKETLKFVNAIQVLQKFEKFERLASIHRSTLIFLGLLVGLFLGVLLSIAKYLRMKIALIRNTRQNPNPTRDLA